MKRHPLLGVLAAVTLTSLSAATGAATAPEVPARSTPAAASVSPAVMLVVDTSGSMNDPDPNGLVKLAGARRAITTVLDELPAQTLIGLRTYPAPGSDCGPGLLRSDLVGIGADAASIEREARSMEADGSTPTADALEAGADDLRAAGFDTGIIILISDGEWNCDRDPCDVAGEIERSGIDVTVNTVGFDLEPGSNAVASLQCVADATGGVYRDAKDADQLIEEMEQLSQGQVALTVTAPGVVTNTIGLGSNSTIRISASVASVGANDAIDVVAYLSFTGDRRPSTVKPSYRLGNIAIGDSRTATWDVPVPLAFDDFDVGFTVTVYGQQVPDVTETGSISFRGEITLADAGPLLTGKEHPVIMGDSYSSGEGAGDYTKETDSDPNSCHRSANTWGTSIYPNLVNLACSGAVALDVTSNESAGSKGNGVPAQALQLAALTDPADLVLMTLGGNDAGFTEVIVQCIVGWKGGLDPRPSDCHRQQVPVARECDEATPEMDLGELTIELKAVLPPKYCIYANGTMEETFLANAAGIRGPLVTAYSAINSVLNSPDWLDRRNGEVAPIVILAYPSPVPDPSRYEEVLRVCPKAMSFEEWKFVARFAAAVNAAVESAVEDARSQGVPVYFVEQSAAAFQPNHSLCDREDSFANYADIDETIWGKLVEGNRWVAGNGFFGILPLLAERWIDVPGEFSYKEAFHPNANGYKAMSMALVQWSTTPPAQEAPTLPERVDSIPLTTVAGETFELQDAGSVTLQQGGNVTLLMPADPGTTVEVRVRSTPHLLGTGVADENGQTRVVLALPRNVAVGAHTLEWTAARDGVTVIEQRPLSVTRPDRWPEWILWPAVGVLGLGAVLLALLALLTRRRTVRPSV